MLVRPAALVVEGTARRAAVLRRATAVVYRSSRDRSALNLTRPVTIDTRCQGVSEGLVPLQQQPTDQEYLHDQHPSRCPPKSALTASARCPLTPGCTSNDRPQLSPSSRDLIPTRDLRARRDG